MFIMRSMLCLEEKNRHISALFILDLEFVNNNFVGINLGSVVYASNLTWQFNRKEIPLWVKNAFDGGQKIYL